MRQRAIKIRIYIEGGGDPSGCQALRQGFDQLLSAQKEAARLRHVGLKLVLCGSRNDAFDAFINATKHSANDIITLLVDAEEPVATPTPAGRLAHLAQRDQHWRFDGIDAERVHLMTQCMEAWIVADPGALTRYYGQGFNANALPQRARLDEEPKRDLYRKLEAATKGTQKGSYGKIKHASALLGQLSPELLTQRCQSFAHFTQWLDATIHAAR